MNGMQSLPRGRMLGMVSRNDFNAWEAWEANRAGDVYVKKGERQMEISLMT